MYRRVFNDLIDDNEFRWGFSKYFDGTTVKQFDKITQSEADYYLQHEVFY